MRSLNCLILLSIFCGIFFSSCSTLHIEKRKYLRGIYVDIPGKQHENNTEARSQKKITEIPAGKNAFAQPQINPAPLNPVTTIQERKIVPAKNNPAATKRNIFSSPVQPADTIPDRSSGGKSKDTDKLHKVEAILSIYSTIGAVIGFLLFLVLYASITATADSLAAIFGVLLLFLISSSVAVALLTALILALIALGIAHKNNNTKITKLAFIAFLLAIAGTIGAVVAGRFYF